LTIQFIGTPSTRDLAARSCSSRDRGFLATNAAVSEAMSRSRWARSTVVTWPTVSGCRTAGRPRRCGRRRGGLALVQAALKPADGAGRHPALDVELEEAGAAVRAAEEPLGARRATAKPAHGSRPSDDGAMECSRKHVLVDPSCRDPMGGLGPRWRSWLLSVVWWATEPGCCVPLIGSGSESVRFRELGRCSDLLSVLGNQLYVLEDGAKRGHCQTRQRSGAVHVTRADSP
jgi:hypothetical protein